MSVVTVETPVITVKKRRKVLRRVPLGPKVVIKKKEMVTSPRSILRDSQLYTEGGYSGEGDRGELLLSREQAPLDRINGILRERGILGNRTLLERIQLSRCKKDPMYTLFFFADHPDTDVVGSDGDRVHLIDFMLTHCFALLADTLGDMFLDFELITKTYDNLMKTEDTHAKIWLFLFILQREKPVQDMLFELYTDEGYTSHRLVHFLQKLTPLVNESVTLPYTDAVNDFNVKNMVGTLLARCISDYMLYTKDPRYDTVDYEAK
jgi:hypothetical protein